MTEPGKNATAYAWQLEDGSLCRWAEPTRQELEDGRESPGPDAKIVRVRIVKWRSR